MEQTHAVQPGKCTLFAGCYLATCCHAHYHPTHFHFVLIKFKDLVAKQHPAITLAALLVMHLLLLYRNIYCFVGTTWHCMNHQWTTSPSIKKAGLIVIQSHPLCRTRFCQYQASLKAMLEWLRYENCTCTMICVYMYPCSYYTSLYRYLWHCVCTHTVAHCMWCSVVIACTGLTTKHWGNHLLAYPYCNFEVHL